MCNAVLPFNIDSININISIKNRPGCFQLKFKMLLLPGLL